MGAALAALVATSFAVGSTAARIAYEFGTDPLSVNTTRALCAAVTLGLVLAVRRSPLAMTIRERLTALGLGVLLGMYSLSLYVAIGRIPVALAVLIFYTFPLLTGVVSWLTGQTRPSARSVGALLVAFVGLVLALDPGEAPLDPLGILYAAAAAIGFTTLLSVNARLFKGRDSQPVTLHMLVGASLVQIVLCLGTGYALPHGIGWAAFAVVTLSYVFSMVGLWIAVAAIGPLKAALFMNFEPIASLALGWLVLHQHLAPIQLVGAALVVASITVGRRDAPAPATPPPARRR
jgi:drug/metabolite transporter (DMT)-like permease